MLSISKPQTNLIYLSILVGRLDLTCFSIYFLKDYFAFLFLYRRLPQATYQIAVFQLSLNIKNLSAGGSLSFLIHVNPCV